MSRLPIQEIQSAFLQALRIHRRLIIQGPTGSGKSTQIPQWLLDHGALESGQVVILQPRRLAARLLASRVAQERQCRLGGEVGYHIRFDDVTGPDTRIRFVTEGILLRFMMAHPDLPGIQALVFDEFHERHLYSDITLAQALMIQETRRPDLLILVMSATLSCDSLEPFLAPCATLVAQGRQFPVSIEFLPPSPHWHQTPVWDLAAQAFERQVKNHTDGDVLIFMPGAYEIQKTLQALRASPRARGWTLLPLHGELAPRDQDAALARYDGPKVIVATNVAETSLTIDGIRWVIDSGLARIPRFDPHRGINTLLVEKISRASADQRTGRAGRTTEGHGIRLWPRQDHEGRPAQETPEIRRIDLSETLLLLKAGGVNDLATFRWLDPPEPRSLQRAEALLTDLGALDPQTHQVTPMGRRMAAFPVHPRYARMFLAAHEGHCLRDAALIAALTQGKDILLRRQTQGTQNDRFDFCGDEDRSDMRFLMKAWQYADQCQYDFEKCSRLGIHAANSRQVRPLRDLFLHIAETHGLHIETEPAPPESVLKCILAGFSDQLAKRCDAASLRCDMVHGRKGMLERSSVARTRPLIVAGEIREIGGGKGKDASVLLSLATAVEETWLQELFPADFTEATDIRFDATTQRVQAFRQRRFRDLALQTRRTDDVPADQAARLLADEITAGRLSLPEWDEAVEHWITRVNCLAAWCPDLALPPITPADRRFLVEQLCHGAFSHKDVKKKPVWPTVKAWLSDAQQAMLDKVVPERYVLPSDRRVRIQYAEGTAPVIAARIQDLYGMTGSIRLALNRVTAVIHVLAPNMRAVQVTQDLTGFWKDAYPAIKKELQRKYPKHEWR